MFLVKHVKLRARYGYGRSTECFPGDGSKEDECYQFRYIETPSKQRMTISSPSTSSSPGTSPTIVVCRIRRKYHRMQAQHSPLSTTARRLLLHKLEGGNYSIERGSRGAAVELGS